MREMEEYNWKEVWREEIEQLRDSSMKSDITQRRTYIMAANTAADLLVSSSSSS